MKIAMLGTGAYGLALSLMLAKKNNSIIMWTENNNLVLEFNETKKLDSVLKDIDIPSSISLTNSFEEAMRDVDIIFIASAAKYVKE